MELPKAISYPSGMAQTLEERVAELEKKFAALSAQVLGFQPRKKDWHRTIGSIPDDELTREAEQLGRAYRKQQTCEKELAGS